MAGIPKRWLPLIVTITLIAVLAAGACKTPGETPPPEEEAAEEEAEEPAAPKPAPPKVNEENYVEILARTVLIREKFGEDTAGADKEIEGLYEKMAVTFADIKEFENRIGPAGVDFLQPKIQEKIQKLLHEYR